MLEDETSIFRSNLPLHEKLEKARTNLLDLSARNRLLNVPRFSKTARTIDIVDEKTSEVYRLLVCEGKAFTFLAGKPDRKRSSEDGADVTEDDADYSPIALADPEGDAGKDPSRHSDTQFQTRMTPKGLQTRLLVLHFDAKTLEEEQGVNILFLAMGMLRWVDPNNKENVRHAPLILVPVRLDRAAAKERFQLKLRPEEYTANLSLEAFLDRVHAISLPPFESGDDFSPITYLDSVADAVASQKGWEVLRDDIVLGFFSFAKFLMYRDLDPENWPEDAKITDQAKIRALLSDGFPAGEPLMSDEIPIDPHIQPADMLHIVDSDSSQTVAIHEARRGRDLVIQGPPGTGKSQTIANIIASAVADGKTVLFVAEKMAALDVVKRRLDGAGVGDVCLELHSNKANKRLMLAELSRTWQLGSPRGQFPTSLNDRLLAARDRLNAHVARLHAQRGSSKLSAYQVLGQLTRLKQQGQPPVDIELVGAEDWSPEDVAKRRALLEELSNRIIQIGLPASHPWRGVGLEVILPTSLERLVGRIATLHATAQSVIGQVQSLADQIEASRPDVLRDVSGLKTRAALLASAPSLEPSAMSSAAWVANAKEVASLLRTGADFERAREELAEWLSANALNTPQEHLAAELETLPANYPRDGFMRAGQLTVVLPRLREEVAHLIRELGERETPDTLGGLHKLVATAERVAAAPDASPDAFIATVWDSGFEQIADLAHAVAELETLRVNLKGRVTEGAWDIDVAEARKAIATHTGILKGFKTEYRKAKALIATVLVDAKAPFADQLRLLDQLTKAQGALAKIRSEDGVGRSAFGVDWRGERSRSAPLQALVAWMGTLKGLGPAPRFIAGRLAERAEAGARAVRVRKVIEFSKAMIDGFWNDLGPHASSMLGVASLERASLSALEAKAKALREADEIGQRAFTSIPETIPQYASLVKGLQRLQSLAMQLDAGSALGESAFGAVWNGRKSDWKRLSDAHLWIKENGELRHLVSRLPHRETIAAGAEATVKLVQSLLKDFDELARELETSSILLFQREYFADVQMTALTSRLDEWLRHHEQLSKWIAYRERVNKAQASGIGNLADCLADGRIVPADILPTFDMAYYERLLTRIAKEVPDLVRFDGELHSKAVRDFANMDKERIKSAAVEVVTTHHRGIPPRQGGAGPVGVLLAEIARKRGHMPIRQLMQRAGVVIQAIKPVFMMSPLSVAQFLTPGRSAFDLLVMDEASQIQPVDALGAIARAKQVVVVGDERQLPPTTFFAKMTGGAESDDDDGAQVADIESILGLFSARGLPQRMLRWHYRSRHQSLIAVSNSQFYDNKLFIVPSPYTQEAGMGLRFHHVPNGVFDSGGTGTNPVEARTVAEAIIRHAKSNPNESLGVATFSVSQRRAIQDELEALRRLNPDCETFFSAHPHEPFFVKNLENVQGDERDVIMISVGYAKNTQGYMAMRFGPLGADGGERRLNVLISRAKRRCEIFASITDEDIDLERGKGKGVFAFKLFLHYARTGRLSLAQATSRPMDSVFEEQVANALMAQGYQVHAQVGIAGFFIDLAIADHKRPGRYILGIECDGAAYHSSRSARDRDRLRQAVLEDHGWIIHRIWSTDWFQRPKEQLQRVIAAIEAAKRQLDDRMEFGSRSERAAAVEIITVEREDVTEIGLASSDDAPAGCLLYEEAQIKRPGDFELHETPTGQMAELVHKVVAVEAPIHLDEVVVRIRDAWGLQRAGARVQEAVERGVDVATRRGTVSRKGAFCFVPDAPITLRDRRRVTSIGLRRPEMISEEEIAQGVVAVVAANFGATEDELVAIVSKMLGFKAISAQIRGQISNAIATLVVAETLQPKDGLLVLASVGDVNSPKSVSTAQ